MFSPRPFINNFGRDRDRAIGRDRGRDREKKY